ncbi:IclR family transcriptional regulator domain-containing protein [Pseudonocardia saturnea]
MLAFAPPGRLAEVLAAGLARRTPRTVVAPGHLVRDLAHIAERGIAEEHEESTVGIACVAAPVLDASGTAVAAVSITGWAHSARHRPARPRGAHGSAWHRPAAALTSRPIGLATLAIDRKRRHRRAD